MSYSIRVKNAEKSMLAVLVRDQLAEVLKTQPLHEKDVDQAFDAAQSLLDLMTDDPERDMVCSVSGSIWQTDAGVQSVSLNISVGYEKKKEPSA